MLLQEIYSADSLIEIPSIKIIRSLVCAGVKARGGGGGGGGVNTIFSVFTYVTELLKTNK